MTKLSLLLSVVAMAISLIALWKTHFAPFSALAVAGRLGLRIYPLKSGTTRWFIASLNVPVSVTNEGAQPGVINGLRLKLHFPKIPIPGNCELVPPAFEVAPEDAKIIDQNRFEWLDKVVVGNWMPFTVLPKETVTKHFVFETRWDDPVIQDAVRCALEIRNDHGEWREVTSWALFLDATTWSELVDVGTGISFDPHDSGSIQHTCVPPDLHKYTGSKHEIPKGGFGAGASFLDYPKSSEDP